MKTVIVASVFALFTAAAFFIVLLNRASEKILTAVIPIAIAGLVGIYMSVFVFGGEPKVQLIFPASFQYTTQTKMPANVPWSLQWRRYHNALFLPAKLHSKHPEYFPDSADSAGTSLYHHLLQRAILDWLAERYGHSWQVESTQFELPTGRVTHWGPVRTGTKPSKVYSAEEIEAALKGNRFSAVHSDMARQLSVPPDTTLAIEAPHTDTAEGNIGKIFLKNKFCELSITTQESSFMRGLGTFKSLAGITDEENEKLGTATYRVRISISYSRLRSGHPEMPLYKEWADGIARGIQEQFDEQVIWSKTKSDYLFLRQMQQFGPVK